MSDFERIYQDGKPREIMPCIEKEHEIMKLKHAILELKNKHETTEIDATNSSKRPVKKSVRRPHKV